MVPLITAEIFSLSKRPASRVLAITGVAIIAFIYLIFAILLQSDGSALDDAGIEDVQAVLSPRNSHIFGFGITQFIASILGIILMSVVITSEYSWRTVITKVNWTGTRGRLLLAQMIVVLMFLAVGVGLGWVTAALGSVVVGIVEGNLTLEGIGPGYAGTVLESWARTTLTVAVYAMLAAAIATVSRSMAVGIAVTLVIRFVEPVGVELLHLLPGGFDALRPLLLAPNVDALLLANGTLSSAAVEAGDEALPNVYQATLYLVGFCLLAGGSAIYSFSRRDIDV